MIIKIEDLPEGRSVKRITFEIDFDETEETSVLASDIPIGNRPDFSTNTQPESEVVEEYAQGVPLRADPIIDGIGEVKITNCGTGKAADGSEPDLDIVTPEPQRAPEGIAPVVPNEMLNATF